MRNSKMFGKGDMRRILGIVLALVMCLGSVSAFAGEAVYGAISEVGKGTTFFFELPIVII